MIDQLKISDKEFQERLNWSLEQKIDHSLYIIENFLAQYPHATISFSGGLDSTVMMKLIRIVDKNRKGVFVNTTNELSEIIRFVKESENIEIIHPKITFVKTVETYGFPLISKKVAQMIENLRNPNENNEAIRKLYLTGITKGGNKSRTFILPPKWKYLIDAPFDVTSKCCDFLKKKPMKPFQKSGIFIGTKALDSRLRRINYQKIGCINFEKNKCTPLSIWTREDIWKFVRNENIPYCDIYDKGEVTTGCAYCGFGTQFDRTRFYRLKYREPKRYELMMNIKNNGVLYRDAIEMVFKRSCNLPPTFFKL